MTVRVREMTLDEVRLRIDYFHNASDEAIARMGVDKNKLPSRTQWQENIQQDYARPIEKRYGLHLIWLQDETPVGISSVDQIIFEQEAYMHLHVLQPEKRNRGISQQALPLSIDIYFNRLKLKRLFCQPNAFNTAPHRALQRAGFQFVETYETIPGPINTYQTITKWVYEPNGPCKR